MSFARRDALSYLFLAMIAAALSIVALAGYYRQNAILLYGDAVAHINIARRVFDSRTPGIFQLGTVWLPLPHLLDLPFVLPDSWWRSGVAASVPQMLAYIAGTLGIFRLVCGRAERGLGSLSGVPGRPEVGRLGVSRSSAWIAAAIYALNPNLLYMQATAMTESLYLALFIWTAVFFSEFVQAAAVAAPGPQPEAKAPQRARKSLERCAICLSAAMLVRYDAWFLAAFVVLSAFFVLVRNGNIHRGDPHPTTRTPRVSGAPDAESRRSNQNIHHGDTETRRKAQGGIWGSSAADISDAGLANSPMGSYENSSSAGGPAEPAPGSLESSSASAVSKPPSGVSPRLRASAVSKAWFSPGLRASVVNKALFSRCLRLSVVSKVLILPALTAALWLAYNYGMFGNPLEFANGPYSARAIQQRSKTATMPTYPGENSPRDATLYFLKLTRLNLSEGPAESLLFAAALVSLLSVLYFSRRYLPLLLLWVPLPFYVLSIAWGSVPIFFPDWWPHSYYNVRYGLQLLPAIAVFTGVGCELLTTFFPRRWILAAAAAAIALSYVPVWRATPITLREAQVNGRVRMEFDQQLAAELRKLPPSATLLMDASAHPGALQQAGIPFRRVIRETNYPDWDDALQHPAESADYVIVQDDDAVARALPRSAGKLEKVAKVSSPDLAGWPQAIIYRSIVRGCGKC